MAKIVGRMDSKQYCHILATSLTPYMDACALLPAFPPRDQLVFQQDNDPKHRSKLATSWFREAGVRQMPWPAQSPDLNPIEQLWQQLKTKIGSSPVPARGVHELWERVEKEWEKIPVETCQRLIESMPRRIEAVIETKGGHIKY